MLGYYSVVDIMKAKEILVKDVELLKLDKLPRFTSHCGDGEGRAAKEVHDIICILTTLDERVSQ